MDDSLQTHIDAPAIRHVVWDWNGTLLDDVDACVLTLNAMLRRRGLDEVDAPSYREHFGFPVRGYYERLGFDFSRESWSAVAYEYHRLYALFSPRAILRPGAVEVLDTVRRSRIPMSILSASNAALLAQMIRERGLDGYFAHIAGLGDLYAESKIDTGRRLLESLDLPPRTVLLIGDTVHDFEVAGALGAACVLVDGGHQSATRLLACGQVLDRIEDVLSVILPQPPIPARPRTAQPATRHAPAPRRRPAMPHDRARRETC